MIGLVQATGIDDVRIALGAAGESLRLGLTHARASEKVRTGEPLPLLFGRKAAFAAHGAGLTAASTHLHEALGHLDAVRIEAGRGADALADVRRGIEELATNVDHRLEMDHLTRRWYAVGRAHEGQFVELDDLADGLDAVASGFADRWVVRDRPHYLDPGPYFLHRRAMAQLDPTLSRMLPVIPEHGDAFQGVRWDEVVQPMLEEGSPDAVAHRDVLWNLVRHTWARHMQWGGVGLHADDLRRMLAVARPGMPDERIPAWLRDAGSETLELDPSRAADLAASAYASREAAELGIATALLSPRRFEFGYDLDHAGVLRDAVHRLPEGIRPDIPEAVITDEASAMAWSRGVRTRRAREFVGEQPPSPALVRDVLLDIPKKDMGQAVGAALVAKELVDALPSDGRVVRDAMVADLRRQLREFVEANERGWFVDYADIGRVQATSETVARVDALIAGRAAAPASTAREPLTW